MAKTLLVAKREYLDNLRTKAFWIGILLVPVIIALSVLVPIWLEGTKDTRLYAVIDKSGELALAEAIERRADAPDLAKVFRHWLEKIRDPEAIADAPAFLRPKLEELRDIEDVEQNLDLIASTLEEIIGWRPADGLGAALATRENIPESARAAIEQAAKLIDEPVRAWWRGLPPAERKQFAPDSSRLRYKRVDIEPGLEDPEKALREGLDRGELFAFFVINEDPVTSDDGCAYFSQNLTDDGLRRWFERLASSEIRTRRLEREGISGVTADWIERRLRFESKTLDEEGEATEVADEDKLGQFAPIAFVYLLWISIFTISQMLLTNTIEEKSSRIIEVLLSSVSPLQLMTGKIIGLAATGLTVVGSWVLSFVLLIKVVLPSFVSKLPDIDFGVIFENPAYLAGFLVYFLFGFLFFAAFFVGIGSVCNSLKEAQNLMTPVVLVLIVPLLAMIPIGQDPNGSLARLLSFIPPFTPFVMMNRAAGPPATWEYVATTALLVVSIVIAFFGAARVFRVGILMTGKPPRPLEILRLLFRSS